jgi:hypothetical protein
MAPSSQTVAAERIQHAAAKKRGTDQDVDDVKHRDTPWSATIPPHAAGMLRYTH